MTTILTPEKSFNGPLNENRVLMFEVLSERQQKRQQQKSIRSLPEVQLVERVLQQYMLESLIRH